MKCPACSANLSDGSPDCPGCGVNFEKWRTRDAEKARSAPAPASRAEAAESEGLFSDFPVFRVAAACLLIGAASLGAKAYKKYLPNGLTDLAKPNYIKKTPSPKEQTAAADAPAAPAGPALNRSGFDVVYAEYSSRASMARVPLKEAEAGKFFQYGVDDALGLSFDDMEDSGMPAPETPFTEEEGKRPGMDVISAKCDGKNGTEYLRSLPGNNTEYTNCWQRISGRAKSSQYVLVIYSDVFQRNGWAGVQWLPNSKRWSPWTDAQQAQAAVSRADKYYGSEAIAAEREKTEKITTEILSAGVAASGMDWRLFETFQLRFRREGLLAGADLLRRR